VMCYAYIHVCMCGHMYIHVCHVWYTCAHIYIYVNNLIISEVNIILKCCIYKATRESS
jgi:hypothetical protein